MDRPLILALMLHHLPKRTNSEYLARQAALESNARSYPRKIPIAITYAKGMEVRDADGKAYLDCLSNAGTLALGHNHPVVVEALQQHLASGLPMQTLDLTTPIKDQFVEELFATFPPEFARHARIQFCGPSGSQWRLPWPDAWRSRLDGKSRTEAFNRRSDAGCSFFTLPVSLPDGGH
jgi:hypothetical protein